jgi:hypothetical protein
LIFIDRVFFFAHPLLGGAPNVVSAGVGAIK